MKWSRARLVVALASFASLASFAVVPLRAQSSVIDIGSLGCCTTILAAINNRGEAVGFSEIAGSDTEHAIVWRDGRLVDLGVLPGHVASRANDINARGQIVGVSLAQDEFKRRPRAVLWQDDRAIDITPPGYVECAALGINAAGDVVGTCDGVPALWRHGRVVRLELLPGTEFGRALKVNERGIVIGVVDRADGRTIPVVWKGGRPTALPMPPGALAGVPVAINARGQITGYVVLPGSAESYEAVLWDGDRVMPLAGEWGAMFGYGQSINDGGDVVVFAFTVGRFEYGSYIWRAGVFHRVLPVGFINDLSETGIAVGWFYTEFADVHGAIWPKSSTQLPEGRAAR